MLDAIAALFTIVGLPLTIIGVILSWFSLRSGLMEIESSISVDSGTGVSSVGPVEGNVHISGNVDDVDGEESDHREGEN